MAHFCGYPLADGAVRPSMLSSTYTRYLDGPRRTEDRALDIGIRPLVSVTSVHQDEDWDYAASDLIDSGDYVVDTEEGVVWLRPNTSHVFGRSPRRFKAIVVAGFAALDDAHPLVELTALAVRALIDTGRSQSTASVSGGRGSVSFVEQSTVLPRIVRAELAPYVLGASRATGGAS